MVAFVQEYANSVINYTQKIIIWKAGTAIFRILKWIPLVIIEHQWYGHLWTTQMHNTNANL